MSLVDLLNDVRTSGIRLSLKDGQLAVSSKCTVPTDMLARIKSQKAEIMSWLGQLADDARDQSDQIQPEPVSEAEPLAFSQSRLWVIDRMESAAGLYNVPVVVRLQGNLDHDALQKALDEIVARHQVLRTVFEETSQGVVQRILPPQPVQMPLIDLSDRSDPESLLALATADEAVRRFDLTRDLMLRTRLVRISATCHNLLLTLHHIATDGWSNGVLMAELQALYHGQSLPKPRLQFTDYARWQRRLLDKRGKDLSDWWHDTLAGAPDLHDLPADLARPPALRGDGANLASDVPGDLAARLRDLARSRGVSLFTLLLSAYATLLHRVSAAEDLVIGTPVAGRERDELKQLVGFLVNTLPLRVKPEADLRFLDFLERCNGTVTSAFAHQALPFEMMVERLNPRRSLSHAPLVQIAFTLAQAGPRSHPAGAAPGTIQFEVTETPQSSAKFELALGVVEQEEGLTLGWTYSTELFCEETIDRYNRCFLSLLEGIADRPENTLADLPLVSAKERARLLALGAGPDRDDGPNPPAPYQLIEHFAQHSPDAIALICRGLTTTYAELNRRANCIAHHLRALGVAAGDAVGVATGRNAAMIEAIVGVNKAGAAFVQVPVDVPVDRVTGILADSGCKILLTQSHLPELASLPGAIALDQDTAWQTCPEDNPPPVDNPICYIVYTSGTTGAPKGALNTHLGLLNMCRWQTGDFAMDADCTQTVAANPAFDAIMWEIWPALSVGGTLAFLDATDLSDVTVLQSALDSLQPSHFWLPTGLMEAMCAAGLQLPPSVRSVSTGGDRLQGYCLPEGCGIPLANIYGPSEAAVITVCAVLQPDEKTLAPIGRPVPNTSAYVIDEAGNLLPEGAIGELCISGPFVGPGYLNRPELTAQKYLPNPFARPGHPVLYRTGDLARWRPDGRLECLGRNDFQVKIRGYRIEPQEVAAVLLEQPGLKAAFVDVLERTDKRLVAYVVADADQTTALLEPLLRDALEQRMPSYMVPDRFVWLADLPLTDRGKIDRRALAALAPEQVRQVNTASPRDDIELKLYKIWSSVLLHPEIGLRDNFFDIGGNSLSAIKIVHQINAAFSVTLAVTEIIAHPTIEQLGGVLRSGKSRSRPQNPICFREGKGEVNVVCIHPGGGTAFAYLSLAKVLPEDFGVWGVQSVGVHPGDAFLPDIGAMSDHYIELIRPLLARPLVITGASFGGFVAFEMVRRLKMAGIETATAVLLDAMGSDDPEITQNDKLSDAAEFRAKLITYNGMYPGIDDDQINQYHLLYNHNTLASRRWNFRGTEGRVLLVQAIKGRSRPELRFLRLFWQLRCRGMFLFKCIAGDHSTMLEGDDVRRVARIISEVLTGRLMPPRGRV